MCRKSSQHSHTGIDQVCGIRGLSVGVGVGVGMGVGGWALVVGRQRLGSDGAAADSTKDSGE